MKNHLLIYSLTLLVAFGLDSSSVLAQSSSVPKVEVPAIDKSAETPTAAASEKQTYSNTNERDNSLLMTAKPTEAQWLETPNEKIVILYKQGETRKTKGALLILHAQQLPQLWPDSLENLRINLPSYGWETMAVPLPQTYNTQNTDKNQPDAAASTVTSKAEQQPSSASMPASSAAASSLASASTGEKNTAVTPAENISTMNNNITREQVIAERTNAAILNLNKKGQTNVVVLVDNSGAVDSLTALYKNITLSTTKTKINGPMQALILVNLQDQEPLNQTQLATIFSIVDLPIIEVFFDPDNQAQIETRRAHNAEAMRKNITHYQQLVLPPENVANKTNKQSFWLEKVRGFIEKYTETQKATKP
jgi:hypothetical protein